MPALNLPCKPKKLDLIYRAFSQLKVRSFVDLGACWGVNGGYAFHGLERFEISRAVLVDARITKLTRERAARYPQLELIQASLGAPTTVDGVGRVDCAILFDILLHQVSPDWDDLLTAYAENIDAFVIYNQNWTGSPHIVRFIELGVDEYLRRVYHSSSREVRRWFGRHDELHPKLDKAWRDVHQFWQWGITRDDLVNHLADLGFRVLFDEKLRAIQRGPPGDRKRGTDLRPRLMTAS